MRILQLRLDERGTRPCLLTMARAGALACHNRGEVPVPPTSVVCPARRIPVALPHSRGSCAQRFSTNGPVHRLADAVTLDLAFATRPAAIFQFSVLEPRLFMAQYVYTMHRLSKVVPPKREILKNISLSFFPGAKIGVLGLNGSGKSTLLKIMAGVDSEFDGEARPMAELNVGYLPQETQLGPNKTLREEGEETARH